MPREIEDSDFEKEAHLLLWISENKQRSLEEVWRSDKFLDALLEIDKQHFTQIKSDSDSRRYTQVFQQMESYITQNLGMRIERKLRSNILQGGSLVRLSELLLFIAVHSADKKRFIEKILRLPNQTQATLMTIIDNLGQSIYATQMADILEKIDALEVENEKLEELITQKDAKYEALLENYQTTKQDLSILQKQSDTLKKQKSNALKELQIDSVDEYIDIVRELQGQYGDNLKTLIKTEQRERVLQSELVNSKNKILQDLKLISLLYEEVESLKSICRNLRGSAISIDQQPFSPFSQSVLKQNKTFSNSTMFDSPSKQSKIHKYESYQDLQDEVMKLRFENKEQKNKIETYYEIMESQKEVILTYKRDMYQLKKCNEVRKWKLQQLQSIHSDLSKLVLPKSE